MLQACAKRGKLAGRLLLVGINQQHVAPLAGTPDGQRECQTGLSHPALCMTHNDYHSHSYQAAK